MDTCQELLKRHEELVALREPEMAQWRDIQGLFAPQEGLSPGDRKRPSFDELFDATQIYAADNLVGGIFGQLTNPANRWVDLAIADDPEMNAWQPAKAALYTRSSIMLSSLSTSVSAFYEEIPQVFGHTTTFGPGFLFSEEDPGKGRIIDRALPLGQMFFDVDAHGEVDTVHREFMLKGRQVRQRFGAITGLSETTEYTIVHAIRRNPDFTPGMIGQRGKAFLSSYLAKSGLPGLERHGGYYEMPVQVFRWKKRAHTPWPIGAGHAAMPDASMLQEMERTHLVAAQHEAEPPLLVDDDSVLSAADIQPNALLYGTLTDGGKQRVQRMSGQRNLQLTAAQSETRRNAIRDAFYFGLMQLMNRPQMTATEFLGFQEEKLRLMGPNLTRIQSALSGFIARRYRMLERAGAFPELPPELEGKRLEIVYNSPLAKAQQAATARAAINYSNTVMQLAQIDPEAVDNIDVDATLAVVHEGLGAPPQIQRDPRKIAEMRAQRQQAQAQAVQLQQTEQAVNIASEAAHAQQAATLAKGRQEPVGS